jgi:peptide deformylase
LSTAIREILRHPDEHLRRKSEPAINFDDQLALLLSTMEKTMRAGPGGVGIAAPQIGENIRLVVVDCRQSQRPCSHHGLLYMANPHIEYSEGEALGREGCLSVPDWVGTVPRSKIIRVNYENAQGIPHTIECAGFEARVIQHEIDHLDGILFIDRVISTRGLIRRLSA